jgi:hypothetical protein
MKSIKVFTNTPIKSLLEINQNVSQPTSIPFTFSSTEAPDAKQAR